MREKHKFEKGIKQKDRSGSTMGQEAPKSNACVSSLMNLGLTHLQATIYVNLARLGIAGAHSIAKASNVYRSEAYRVMLSLEKLGLAEKVVSDPVMYRATPIREGLQLLIQNKTTELANMRREAAEALVSIQDSNLSMPPQQDPQFVICSSEKLFFKCFIDRYNTAKISIDSIANWRALSPALVGNHHELKKIVKRGVKMRMLTEKHKDEKLTNKIIQGLLKNPLFEIRYLPFPVQTNITVFDGAQVDFCVSSDVDAPVPSLWSNHSGFLKVINTYFDTIWAKSDDSPLD